ncbi:ATP-dependent endopeptidase Lon [Geobacillus sp. WSUCF1]|nr:ATP-dependent endopeptidase Lon [Geobacillus sp. WSUCF1]
MGKPPFFGGFFFCRPCLARPLALFWFIPASSRRYYHTTYHLKAGGYRGMDWTNIVLVIQLFFGVIIGLYFWNLLRGQRVQKVSIDKESRKEMEQLRKLRSISLTEPLAEKVRPKSFDDIVGQEDGIKALKAALCGPNPQHVIIYGPPGVGKTAAARLVLEEAKKKSALPV